MTVVRNASVLYCHADGNPLPTVHWIDHRDMDTPLKTTALDLCNVRSTRTDVINNSDEERQMIFVAFDCVATNVVLKTRSNVTFQERVPAEVLEHCGGNFHFNKDVYKKDVKLYAI